MSWDGYVKQLTEGNMAFEKAAVLGLDGSTWAASSGLQFQGTEVNDILKGFVPKISPDSKTAPASSPLSVTGIRVGGTKYMFVRAEGDEIIGAQGNKGGVAIERCNQCVLIGLYVNPMTGRDASYRLSKTADYLRQSGF